MSIFTLTIAAGIIPANTGRMHDHIGADAEPQDHPREYGENTPTAASTAEITGSSPRIRGESKVS